MGISPFSRSQKRYIRREKARLRREVLDPQKRQALINQLLERFSPKKKAENFKKAVTKKKEEVAAK